MRCEDCLDDLPSRHFVVPDVEEEDAGCGLSGYPNEKHVCADCAGWYGGEATEVTA